MKSFFVLLGLVAAELDCSSYPLWLAGLYPTEGYIVKHEGLLYQNGWYASATQVPGVDAAWGVIGNCSSGASEDLEIDCRSVAQWTATEIYSIPTDLVHNGRLWRNPYYSHNAEPGVAAEWTPLGVCSGSIILPSTNYMTANVITSTPMPHSTAMPHTIAIQNRVTTGITQRSTQAALTTLKPISGNGVDCSSAHRWSGTYIYGTEGELAHFKGKLYAQRWYTVGVKPETLEGWTLMGDCIPGTAILGVPTSETGLGPVGEERLCSCCKGCATHSGTTPICLDDVTDEWDCLNTWCPLYNSFDTDMCQKVKEDGMLEWYSGELAEGHTNWPSRVFIPYIDVTLGKIPLLTDVHAASGASYFVLAFVTSTGNGCSGGFGGFVPVAKGATWYANGKEMNIYSQVNEIRKLGGDVIVSLGGAAGVELADAPGCQGGDAVEKLKKAYEAVLDATKSTVLDFDIEGPAASSDNQGTGWKNRFEAVKQIISERPDTQVWWTLATWPRGLTPDGKLFIRDLMKSGVRFDAINLMTMDYGEDDDHECRVNGVANMHLCEQMAIDSVARDLYEAALELGLASTYGWSAWTDAYKRLGSTSMIGVNDVVSEVYTLADAAESMKIWKSDKPIKIVSQWSLARDSPCSISAAADPSCSGANMQQEDFEYSKVFQSIMSW